MTQAEEKELKERVNKLERQNNFLMKRLGLKPTEEDWDIAMAEFLSGNPASLTSCIDREGIQS